MATLHDALAEEFADDPCVVTASVSWTWDDVRNRTRRLASWLRDQGFGTNRAATGAPAWTLAQDTLGILLHNGSEYLEAQLGAHKASLAPFNINYRYTPKELLYLLSDADPAVLVYGGVFAPLVEEVLPQLTSRPMLLQVGGSTIAGAVDYETALAGSEPEVFDPSPDDCQLLYTGGTTGMPKGVIWRSGDLVAGPFGVSARDGAPLSVEEAVARAHAIRGRVLPASPLMHGAGLALAMGGWLGGGAVVIPPSPEKFDAGILVDTIERERVTTVMIVGDAFGRPIVEELDRRPRTLSDLKLVVSSGAALRPQVREQLGVHLPGARFTELIASSEGVKMKKDGTGRIRKDNNINVLNDDRTGTLASGEGWLAQSGPIPLGYLGDPEKTASTFVCIAGQRYSVAGDRGYLHRDGTVEFLGRDVTTINTGGEKVFADEVEEVVRGIPGVADAVVVGRPSETWGMEVVTLVQWSADPPVEVDLMRMCRKSLAGYKVPKSFINVTQVVRHANGKPDYKWARAVADRNQELRMSPLRAT